MVQHATAHGKETTASCARSERAAGGDRGVALEALRRPSSSPLEATLRAQLRGTDHGYVARGAKPRACLQHCEVYHISIRLPLPEEANTYRNSVCEDGPGHRSSRSPASYREDLSRSCRTSLAGAVSSLCDWCEEHRLPSELETSLMSGRSRILVTGGTGHLGYHVVEALRAHQSDTPLVIATLSRCASATAATHFRVDIARRKRLLECLERYEPTHIVHLAALSSPAKADSVKRTAWATNVEAVETLSTYARDHGCRVVFTSTDFVFRGDLGRPYTEADQPDPNTFYGRTKLAAEGLIASSDGLVLRLSLVHRSLNAKIPSRLTRMIEKGLKIGWIAAADDEYRTPVRATDAAAAIVALALMDTSGVFHLAGPEMLSPYTLLRREVELSGLNIQIRPVKREALSPPSRPENVCLDTSKLRRLCPNLTFDKVASSAQGRATSTEAPQSYKAVGFDSQ